MLHESSMRKPFEYLALGGGDKIASMIVLLILASWKKSKSWFHYIVPISTPPSPSKNK